MTMKTRLPILLALMLVLSTGCLHLRSLSKDRVLDLRNGEAEAFLPFPSRCPVHAVQLTDAAVAIERPDEDDDDQTNDIDGWKHIDGSWQYEAAKRKIFPYCAEPVFIGDGDELDPFDIIPPTNTGLETHALIKICTGCSQARKSWLRRRWFKQHVLRNNYYVLTRSHAMTGGNHFTDSNGVYHFQATVAESHYKNGRILKWVIWDTDDPEDVETTFFDKKGNRIEQGNSSD